MVSNRYYVISAGTGKLCTASVNYVKINFEITLVWKKQVYSTMSSHGLGLNSHSHLIISLSIFDGEAYVFSRILSFFLCFQ